jgi:hypothetical protein
MKSFRLPRPLFSVGMLVVTLGGCGELDAPGEPLSLFASTLDPAYLEEEYTFDFVVTGGLAPYNFEVREGRLPPGLTLENGSLSGTPTEAGNFDFSLQVSDANLSQAVEDYSLNVTTAPPAELVLNVPPTTINETVRIPISVREARSLQALRTRITWDETLFEFVGGSVRAAQGSLALVQRARAGQLSVDLAFLGPSLNGDAELFSFELRPVEPNTLTLEARTEYRSRDGEHGFSSTEDSAELPEENLDGDDLDGDGIPDDEDIGPDEEPGGNDVGDDGDENNGGDDNGEDNGV